MPHTRLTSQCKPPECSGQPGCQGWRSDLVGDDAQFISFAHQAQHGPHEVGTASRIDPACAHDDRLVARCILASGLARAINRLRIALVFGAIAVPGRTIENEIGRNLHQFSARAAQRRRESRRRSGVDRVGKIRFALRLVNRGIGGRIEHDIGPFSLDNAGNRCAIGKVKRPTIQSDTCPSLGCSAQQRLADLPVHAGYQRLHGKVLTSASDRPVVSLAESLGSIPSSGHSMPTAGSFQARLPSFCGA